MFYYGSRNDWWDYLRHSETKEREGHKYYARVPVGTDKRGYTEYRYFYDAREYGAWKTRQQKASQQPSKFDSETKPRKAKGRTTFITGWGNDGLPDDYHMNYLNSIEGTKLKTGKSTRGDHIQGRDTEYDFTNTRTGKTSVYRQSTRKVQVKTVKNKKKRKSLTERGKEIINRLLRKKKK